MTSFSARALGAATVGVLATGAALVPVFVPRDATDYSALPPDPASMHATLGETKTSLYDAVAAAESKLENARVASVEFRDGAYEALVFTPSERHLMVVDGDSGAVVADEALPRFPGRPAEGEWTETESGLKYFDIVEGTGDTPPSSSTTVEVHYSGWLVDGTKFDSSVDRGQPAQFPLNGVIRGWTEGVGSMRVGGVRKLILPYSVAYGASGRPPTIPPKATLIFDVELLRIVR